MRKFFIFFLFTILCCNVFAQKQKHQKRAKKMHDSQAHLPKGPAEWKKGASFSLFAGQTGSKNWASGSDLFSLSVNAFGNAYANRTRGRWYWNNQLALSYGLISTDEYRTIKNDDKIDYFTSLGFNTRHLKHIGFGAAYGLRTQFSNGYDRNYLNQGLKRRTSGLFAPAYITLAPIGIEWKTRHLDFYGGPAFRAVIVSNSPYSYVYQGGDIPGNFVNDKNTKTKEVSLAQMYGVDPAKEVRWEYGLFLSLGYNVELCKNVNYAGRMDVFSDVNHDAPQNAEVFWTNMFTLKVNNWLRAIYSIDLAYDDNIKKFGYFRNHADFQAKSILGVGVSLNSGWGMHGMHKKMEMAK